MVGVFVPDFRAGRDKLVEPVHDRGGGFPLWLPASGDYCKKCQTKDDKNKEEDKESMPLSGIPLWSGDASALRIGIAGMYSSPGRRSAGFVAAFQPRVAKSRQVSPGSEQEAVVM